MTLDLYSFYKDLKLKKVLFCYSGPIAQAGIEGISYTIRRNLEFEETANAEAQAIFSIFVEQVQNVLNYSAEKLSGSREPDEELRVGIVVIGRQEDGSYFIYCGNKIYNSDILPLKEKIETIRNLDKDELKALYRERRRMEPEPGCKGAGLGLIEIARKAGKPIEYSFADIDDAYSFFSIKVIVRRQVNG